MASPSNDPIERNEDLTSGGGGAATRDDGDSDQRPAMVLRLLLAGLIAMAGLAVASPGGRGAVVPTAGSCAPPITDVTGDGAPDVIVLPPGHPPVRGLGPQGQPVVTLPPGHPPVDGRRRGLPLPLPVRPQQPVFAAPTTVDL